MDRDKTATMTSISIAVSVAVAVGRDIQRGDTQPAGLYKRLETRVFNSRTAAARLSSLPAVSERQTVERDRDLLNGLKLQTR